MRDQAKYEELTATLEQSLADRRRAHARQRSTRDLERAARDAADQAREDFDSAEQRVADAQYSLVKFLDADHLVEAVTKRIVGAWNAASRP